MTTLAIDIGGTKIAAGIVTDDGALLVRSQRPTKAHGDGEFLFLDLVELVNEVRSGHEPVRVGVGSGGPMTRGGEAVSPLNITAWRGFPLRARLAEATGLPTHVDNDAKALALGEGWIGAAVGVSDFLAMVVSTGVGGGIVLDGRLLDGADGNAGHIGHVFVTDDSTAWAGHPAGLLETDASGTAIAIRTGAPAAMGDETVIARTGLLIGRAVGSVANLLDLQLAVIAGSVALGYGEPFFAAAQEEADRITAELGFSSSLRIIPGGLGDEGPLVGAAAVALRASGVDIGIA